MPAKVVTNALAAEIELAMGELRGIRIVDRAGQARFENVDVPSALVEPQKYVLSDRFGTHRTSSLKAGQRETAGPSTRLHYPPLFIAEARDLATAEPQWAASFLSASDPWAEDMSVRIGGYIAAADFRQIIINLAHKCRQGGRDPDRGVVIDGLRIVGELDLSRLSLPFALRLRHCVLAEGISLDWAKVQSIDLTNCIVGRVNATYMTVEGNLRWIASLFTSAVDFGGATFQGVFDFRRSYVLPGTCRFFFDENQCGRWLQEAPRVFDPNLGRAAGRANRNRRILREDLYDGLFIDDRNALNLSLCKFRRDLRLTECVVLGGISMINAQADGSVFINRAVSLSCIEASRLLSKPAPVYGDDYYRFGRPPLAEGLRELSGGPSNLSTRNEAFIEAARAHLGRFDVLIRQSALYAEAYTLGGPRLDNAPSASRRSVSRMSISAIRGAGVTIKQNLFLKQSYLLGSVRLKYLKVGGAFDASGCAIRVPVGNLKLSPSTEDAVEMLPLGDGQVEPDSISVPTPALYLDGMDVGGEADFTNCYISGSIRMPNGCIGDSLSFSGMIWSPAQLIYPAGEPPNNTVGRPRAGTVRRPLLSARGLRVGGDLRWARYSRQNRDLEESEADTIEVRDSNYWNRFGSYRDPDDQACSPSATMRQTGQIA